MSATAFTVLECQRKVYIWICLLSISGQNQVKQGCGVVTKQLFMPVPHFTPLDCIWYIYIYTVYTCIHTVKEVWVWTSLVSINMDVSIQQSVLTF